MSDPVEKEKYGENKSEPEYKSTHLIGILSIENKKLEVATGKTGID